MTGGTAVSLSAEVCAESIVFETSGVVEVIGVLVEVVVLVAATEAVLCVVAGSVITGLSSLGAGSACT